MKGAGIAIKMSPTAECAALLNEMRIPVKMTNFTGLLKKIRSKKVISNRQV